jgi:hypothetical protein
MLSLFVVTSAQPRDAPAADSQPPLEVARRALQRGLHNKAFEALREAHRSLEPHAAWAHLELQEARRPPHSHTSWYARCTCRREPPQNQPLRRYASRRKAPRTRDPPSEATSQF